MSLAAIMTEPDFGEICFLVALILCVIYIVVTYMSDASVHLHVLLAAAVGFLALGFLAL
jgi:hypothetical protein